MKKNALKETKAAKKSMPVRKEGSGGARPNAGKKKKYNGETQQLNIDTPTVLIGAMSKAGIKNKTEYIHTLIKKDLKKKGFYNEAE